MGGIEDSVSFPTFSNLLSGTSVGDDGNDDVVPTLLGPVHALFSSSEGVQDQLRGTRHCDHH